MIQATTPASWHGVQIPAYLTPRTLTARTLDLRLSAPALSRSWEIYLWAVRRVRRMDAGLWVAPWCPSDRRRLDLSPVHRLAVEQLHQRAIAYSGGQSCLIRGYEHAQGLTVLQAMMEAVSALQTMPEAPASRLS